MHQIALVCSVHRENGFCNAAELLKILRAIEPEVVFEEIRPSDFESYCKNGIQSSLEAQAIARYLEFKPIRRVPVDRYDFPIGPLLEIKREFDRVFDYVELVSEEYRLLADENDVRVREHGLNYLNSAAFEVVSTRLSQIEDRAINEAGDQGLTRVLERWRQFNLRREREMVGAIYEYCRDNVFESGVFLVGAAHKVSVVKEIQERAKTDARPIDWRLGLGLKDLGTA